MIVPVRVTLGSDPEGFFQRDGNILGSEKFIPGAGKTLVNHGRIVRDGVQFELQPIATYGYPQLAANITNLLREVEAIAAAGNATIAYNGLVEVSRKELDSLSPETRVLGCQPSHNFYGSRPINVDAATYRKRSSGGHIHIGLANLTSIQQYDTDYRERLVPLLDIFVGNTAVLLDRDPGAAERRENYGRAGEFRLPSYGLEYRTLSNFWLRDYALMSLMFSLTEFAVSVLHYSFANRYKWEEHLAGIVDIDAIALAINTNDFDMALKNFEIVTSFIANQASSQFQLHGGNIKQFVAFAAKVGRNGLDEFFPVEGIVERWKKQTGFSTFLSKL